MIDGTILTFMDEVNLLSEKFMFYGLKDDMHSTLHQFGLMILIWLQCLNDPLDHKLTFYTSTIWNSHGENENKNNIYQDDI